MNENFLNEDRAGNYLEMLRILCKPYVPAVNLDNLFATSDQRLILRSLSSIKSQVFFNQNYWGILIN